MHDLIIGGVFAAIVFTPCLTAYRAIRQPAEAKNPKLAPNTPAVALRARSIAAEMGNKV